MGHVTQYVYFTEILLEWELLIAASDGCDFVCRVAIESCKFDDVAVAVRWLLRHMPLVSPAAKDIEFRMVHPYAAPSEDIFLQWNTGKQRAAEVSHVVIPIVKYAGFARPGTILLGQCLRLSFWAV